MKRKVCIFTGTRAEYGLLYWLMKEIQNEPDLELQLIVAGTHLSPEFGLTYKEIEKEGFKIDKKVEMLLSADTPSAISKSTGLGLIGFADAFNDLKPDLIVLFGDRYELIAVALCALFFRLPIAHIGGGESTFGAFDEALRHSITKMAWWHFVASDKYRNQVIQLGENPEQVFNVGGMSVDAIKKTSLFSKKELIQKTGIQFRKKNFLITYHPTTLEIQTSQKHFQSLLDVLDNLQDVYLIFTMPNADTDSRVIKKMIDDFVAVNKDRAKSFTSLGSLIYLSILQFVDAVVGNSSSGLGEAPSFKIGTINIGGRQSGRLKAESIIDCDPDTKSITQAIATLYGQEFQEMLKTVRNPFGDGDATEKILDILKNHPIPMELKKEFHEL